jgi:dTDP-4-dehydrorhamnose 3,5-epimerase
MSLPARNEPSTSSKMPRSERILGVETIPLERHRDHRGMFIELHRASWTPSRQFVQWNHVISNPGVLRGVHVHRRHSDVVFLVAGRARFGLKDLRRGSPTFLLEQVFEFDAEESPGLVIPTGVAHGFFFHTEARHVYAVDAYFDPTDELGCAWNDPEIGLFRDIRSPLLSPRDASAGSLALVIAEYEGR